MAVLVSLKQLDEIFKARVGTPDAYLWLCGPIPDEMDMAHPVWNDRLGREDPEYLCIRCHKKPVFTENLEPKIEEINGDVHIDMSEGAAYPLIVGSYYALIKKKK